MRRYVSELNGEQLISQVENYKGPCGCVGQARRRYSAWMCACQLRVDCFGVAEGG